jgi:hypothetical protein
MKHENKKHELETESPENRLYTFFPRLDVIEKI